MQSKPSLNIIISTIKQKKELRHLDNSFIEQELRLLLRREPKLAAQVQQNLNPKSQVYKTIVKKVRAELRKVYGVFRQQKPHSSLSLETHASTRERLSFYPELYKQIFNITGKPKTILDFGCGLNPLSIPLMKLSQLDYYAYDLSTEEIEYLNSFFQQYHNRNPLFHGKAQIFNLLETNEVKSLPHADIAFLFKVTDALDRNKGHKATEELLNAIPAEYLIVSFSTKTLSGKKMTAPRRRWMEWLCERLHYQYTILEFENELFYIVQKHMHKF